VIVSFVARNKACLPGFTKYRAMPHDREIIPELFKSLHVLSAGACSP